MCAALAALPRAVSVGSAAGNKALPARPWHRGRKSLLLTHAPLANAGFQDLHTNTSSGSRATLIASRSIAETRETLYKMHDPPLTASLPEVNDAERDLFELVTELVDTQHAAGNVERKTVVRVAGGWVRDKLMGKLSDDVDLTVDQGDGVEFAEALRGLAVRWQEEGKKTETLGTGSPEKKSGEGSKNAISSKIGVVKANPDQSKHLQTATMRLFNLELDLNQLRAETYSEQSRIPEIKVGTPLEDAQRRDFTVNSLFYNIASGLVEDHTGGLQDIKEKRLRTPLPAMTTFRKTLCESCGQCDSGVLGIHLKTWAAVRHQFLVLTAFFQLPHQDIKTDHSTADAALSSTSTRTSLPARVRWTSSRASSARFRVSELASS